MIDDVELTKFAYFLCSPTRGDLLAIGRIVRQIFQLNFKGKFSGKETWLLFPYSLQLHL